MFKCAFISGRGNQSCEMSFCFSFWMNLNICSVLFKPPDMKPWTEFLLRSAYHYSEAALGFTKVAFLYITHLLFLFFGAQSKWAQQLLLQDNPSSEGMTLAKHEYRLPQVLQSLSIFSFTAFSFQLSAPTVACSFGLNCTAACLGVQCLYKC